MKRLLAAVVSGLLLAASFPRLEWRFCAWFALVPLLLALRGASSAAAFRLGWTTGMTFFLVTFDWIPEPILRTAHAPLPVAWAVLALLAAVLALYVGLFGWGVRLWEARTGCDGLLLAVFLWTALEWGRSTLLLPCPWNLLGYSQARDPSLVQLVEVTGVYGLGALVVAVNAAVGSRLLGRPGATPRLLAVAAVCGMVWAGGAWRLRDLRGRPPTGSLKVALVQPAIDPNQKWDPASRDFVLTRQEELSRIAAREGAELVVWPEASAPYVFAADAIYDREPELLADDRQWRDRMLLFVRELRVPLLFGSAVLDPRPVGRGEIWTAKNRALLLSPAGEVEGYYDKRVLVPFGEYVPLARLLFFVEKLVPGMGMFEPGTEPIIFAAARGRFGVLICYEGIFPGLSRDLVRGGASFLVNITNDGWFGDTAGPHQHLAIAAVRAVETRRPLVRVANTGISAVVDPDGSLRGVVPLGQAGVETLEIAWSDRETFYARHGDLFAAASALAAAAMIVYAGRIRS